MMRKSTVLPSFLFPYQKKGVAKLLHFLGKNGCCYLADEQGLGKTIQVLTAINQLGCRSVLVVCPASLRLNWINEAKQWIPKSAEYEHYALLSGRCKVPDNLHEKKFILAVSYALVSSHKGLNRYLKDHSFDAALFDESHYLKNPHAKRTTACLKVLWEKAKYKICMSGTPLPNNVVEGYPIFSKMLPGRWPHFYAYEKEFARKMRTPWGFKYVGFQNLEALAKEVHENFLIRRLKRHVLKDLPPKQFQIITIEQSNKTECDPETVKLLNASIQGLRSAPKKTKDDIPIATVRKELGISKVKEGAKVIELELVHTKPLVVFCYHKQVIKDLTSTLSAVKPSIRLAKIDGSTAPAKRQSIVDSFQAGMIDVLICQIHACATGITLTRASTAIYLEIDYSPSIMLQSIDRIHRIGQREHVRILYLCADNSLDQLITKTLIKKLKSITQIIKT